ncbi:unnamed protein product [Rhizophagus irregularis]|uniref:Uncharacterized protein n=1 Tax=Rhizophagus irregularis TaxID=588596 RepID=A0A2I1G2G7_9GLOM|nr:hypothetical protein RhiirA4_454272 [Rhizophagus irregularis]CAB4439144.1 unnamed protein product [Rhizophagus irregularis]
MSPNNHLKLTILMSLYLSVRAQNCYSLNSNAFYFYPNQASFIHVTPSIISYLSGKCVIELDLRSEQLPLNLDTNKVGLGIYVNLPNKYEEYKVYGFTDYLSDLGGFYSFIEGTFSFIFGSGKLEPWGKAQILFLFGIPYIIKYSKDLVSSSGGIPLAEKVKVISEKDDNKSIESLRERVQTLETLLKEYYLDDYYLVKVKDLKIHRDGLMKHLEKV